MNALIAWVLLELGLVYLITESMIFSPLRMALARSSMFLAGLLYCPACAGFWVGLALGLLGAWPEALLRSDLRLLEPAIAGVAVGALWGSWHPNPAWALERPEPEPEETALDDSSQASEEE